MSGNSGNKLSVLSVWKESYELLKKKPVIAAPFLFTALFYIAGMCVVYLSPRYPLSTVFSPIVKAFWGDRFLHYPFNLILFPTLFNYSKNAIDFTFGLIMSGITISMTAQLFQSGEPSWFFGFGKSVKRYFRMLGLWVAVFVLIYAFSRTSYLLLEYVTTSVKAVVLLMFLFGVLIQALFAFGIPAVIVENRKLPQSFKRAVALFKNYPVKLLLVVLGPNLIVLPFLFVNMRGMMEKSFPEISILFVAAKIFFILLADIFYTVSVTVFFMKNKEIEGRL
ncbi:MAG TPA: hypothetical protein DEE98_01940 [Elusimicrobia bacterium]|nr:MAG: hypothetical protein A2278_05740 [Elusimicrobia bacterium RIFOXYA12_FULL_49_49]OGS07246.1 MAG: hypothetical protein A2204_04890 [Elusimicrobia bacterium RIFOXYA1_FULL_47_7]OGS09378.1 MAG: hypothetical protein A2386_04140 [Elusimicrobia bacterium RIFOXYB1_FULL_48_9]OGS15410.1 MAG: hypothetical protein A2251_07570 [Elusimicrobia bacterium RIFOXYA2_FULL_47_53]OGS26250.1 MAG: hypothetical protein A2339_01490 [Elusimicrobia bacterium RIFOXYB12_FULL_50_12]OGS30838.1 MAG: hypothetical protein